MATDTQTTARAKYELVKRNQATMQQVTALLEAESNKVLSLAQQFDRQQLGGYLRTVVPGLVDRYGNVNAAAAMKYYDEQRALSFIGTGLSDWRRGSQRIAAAKLKSQIFVASLPQFDTPAISEPIIGWGMSQYVDNGFDAMKQAVTSSMTRAVGSFNRDTIIYNAGLDEAVYRVQRVAEPKACEFCRLVAFESYRGSSNPRTASYAIDFHDHCHCSIETIYVGDKPVRPDYYDQFEQNYIEAAQNVGTRDAKRVLAEMRRLAP